MDEFFEPEDSRDIYIDGIAKVEPISSGLVRFYLYAVEGINQPVKVIRARLILGIERAMENNREAEASLNAIHKKTRGLKVVSQIALGLFCFM